MKPSFIYALLIPLIFGTAVRAGVATDASPAVPAQAESNELALKPSNPETQIDNSPLDTTSTGAATNLNMSPSIGAVGAEDTATTMTWPAIPGESLNDIARLFYPKNKIMRQQFVAETLALNTDIEPKLKASNLFAEPTLLQIPTLKSLSQKVSVIKAKRAKLKRQKMQMSYNINQAASKLPAFLLQEYEALLAKNAFLKAELERLQARLGVLQDKFNQLKLVFDKTMSFPAAPDSGASPEASAKPAIVAVAAETPAPISPTPETSVAPTPLPETSSTNTAVADTSVATNAQPVKKVFKNLNQAGDTVAPITTAKAAPNPAPEPAAEPVFSWLKYGLLLVLGVMIVLSVLAYLIRKRRQHMLDRLSDAMPTMEDTITQFGSQWQDTEQETQPGSPYVVEHSPNASTTGFLNTEMRDEQAKATSTLEEAKLLMSINRTQDAIAHLKLTIETQPKASINHWLYLLEIFRKQNAKEAFEEYAKSLHQTFNVMTPVWYETSVAIVVSQHLEEFPHIMEKLDAVWPSELARVYLESLITDNRDGERAGFSHAVLDEILLLISLLDTRKELDAVN